jgi:hypothetical protein
MGVILRVSVVEILFLLCPFLLDTFGMLIKRCLVAHSFF